MNFRRKLYLIFGVLVLVIAGSLTWFWSVTAQVIQSQQIMSGEYGKGPPVGTIGHLGGVPVSIPKGFAHFVEYDGDPGLMEPRKEKAPKRTYQSGIRSFGFDIHYPDMAPVSDSNWAEKRKESISTTTWISVGILSNSYYGYDVDDKTARFAKAHLESARRWHRFEPLAEKPYGLIVYAPVDVDLSRRMLSSEKRRDSEDRNIYVHQLKDGDIDTFIDCSNMEHAAAPCEQFFALNPAMKANVKVLYRKGLLPHWREIQAGVTQVLLGFHVNPPAEINPE